MMPDVADYLPQLLAAYAAYVIGTISPGPANVMIMATSMRHGRRAGVQLAAGVVLGSLTWGVLAALGLSAFLARYGGLMEIVRILGGLYLLWLALRSLRSALRPPTTLPMTDAGSRRGLGYFALGLAIHLTNPKAIFVWLAIISIGVTAQSPPAAPFLVVLGCWLMGICIFGGYALAFSTRRMIGIYAGLRRWIDSAAALVFCAGGLKLLFGQR